MSKLKGHNDDNAYIDDFESDGELSYADDLYDLGMESGKNDSKPRSEETKEIDRKSPNQGSHISIHVSNSSRPLHKSNSKLKKRSKANISWIKNGTWSLGENIGKGSFGSVYQCMNDKGKLYAVKKIEMVTGKRETIDDLVDEIDLMRGLCHPNIVEYIGATVDEDQGLLYIFQEWVSGGSVAHLLKRFGPFKEGVVMNYTKQILVGLSYLHENNIVHRDIKGGNVLVDESGTVKLADFGASTRLDLSGTQELKDIKGTPYFMAPEVLANSRYGRRGDIWAVGCTMVQMLTGEPPWKDRKLQGLVQLHMLLNTWPGGPPPMQLEVELSADIQKCLNLCFQKNDKNRPLAHELLQYDFFIRMNHDDDDDTSAYSTADMNSLQDTHSPMKSFEGTTTMTGLKEKMHRALSICTSPTRNNQQLSARNAKEIQVNSRPSSPMKESPPVNRYLDQVSPSGNVPIRPTSSQQNHNKNTPIRNTNSNSNFNEPTTSNKSNKPINMNIDTNLSPHQNDNIKPVTDVAPALSPWSRNNPFGRSRASTPISTHHNNHTQISPAHNTNVIPPSSASNVNNVIDGLSNKGVAVEGSIGGGGGVVNHFPIPRPINTRKISPKNDTDIPIATNAESITNNKQSSNTGKGSSRVEVNTSRNGSPSNDEFASTINKTYDDVVRMNSPSNSYIPESNQLIPLASSALQPIPSFKSSTNVTVANTTTTNTGSGNTSVSNGYNKEKVDLRASYNQNKFKEGSTISPSSITTTAAAEAKHVPSSSSSTAMLAGHTTTTTTNNNSNNNVSYISRPSSSNSLSSSQRPMNESKYENDMKVYEAKQGGGIYNSTGSSSSSAHYNIHRSGGGGNYDIRASSNRPLNSDMKDMSASIIKRQSSNDSNVINDKNMIIAPSKTIHNSKNKDEYKSIPSNIHTHTNIVSNSEDNLIMHTSSGSNRSYEEKSSLGASVLSSSHSNHSIPHITTTPVTTTTSTTTTNKYDHNSNISSNTSGTNELDNSIATPKYVLNKPYDLKISTSPGSSPDERVISSRYAEQLSTTTSKRTIEKYPFFEHHDPYSSNSGNNNIHGSNGKYKNTINSNRNNSSVDDWSESKNLDAHSSSHIRYTHQQPSPASSPYHPYPHIDPLPTTTANNVTAYNTSTMMTSSSSTSTIQNKYQIPKSAPASLNHIKQRSSPRILTPLTSHRNSLQGGLPSYRDVEAVMNRPHSIPILEGQEYLSKRAISADSVPSPMRHPSVSSSSSRHHPHRLQSLDSFDDMNNSEEKPLPSSSSHQFLVPLNTHKQTPSHSGNTGYSSMSSHDNYMITNSSSSASLPRQLSNPNLANRRLESLPATTTTITNNNNSISSTVTNNSSTTNSNYNNNNLNMNRIKASNNNYMNTSTNTNTQTQTQTPLKAPSKSIQNNLTTTTSSNNTTTMMNNNATTTTTSSIDYEKDGKWKCLKCNYVNHNPDFCDNCATKKGVTGKRDILSAIPRM